MPIWIKFFSYSVAVIFWLLGPYGRGLLAKGLAWLWFDLFRFRRYTILKNLQISLPQLAKEEKYLIARKSMFHLCRSFFEFLVLPMRRQKWMEHNIVFDGIENYIKAHALGKGVLGLSLHLGAGDVGCAMISLRGLKVNLISKKFKLKFFNDFWFGVRESMGTKFIDPHGRETPFQILSGLKKNEIVIFVLDQFMSKPFGIETIFFGRKTGTAYGLALFALRTEAPVIPIYTFFDKIGKLHVVFGQVISSEVASAQREQQILELTQRYNDNLEGIIKSHPENWMWIHRRWKIWG